MSLVQVDPLILFLNLIDKRLISNVRNRSPSSREEILNIVFPVVFITEEQAGELFKSGDEAGWEVFHTRFPDAQGIYTLSRVGFNEEGNQALVYMGLQSQDFTGGYYSFLGKDEGMWTSLSSFMIWGP